MVVGQMNLVRLPRRHFQTSPTGVQAFLHREAIIKPRGPPSLQSFASSTPTAVLEMQDLVGKMRVRVLGDHRQDVGRE